MAAWSSFVLVVYHVVTIGHGSLRKFCLMVIGCVLRWKLCRPTYYSIITSSWPCVISVFYLAISSAVHSLLPLPLVSWRSGESPGTRPSTSTSSTVAGTSTLAELPVFSFHLKFYRIIHNIAQLWTWSHHLYSSTIEVPWTYICKSTLRADARWNCKNPNILNTHIVLDI